MGANCWELIAIGLGVILRVIYFAHEAGVSDGDVVALEIIVDVDLPVAIDDVVAALDGLQAFELEAAGLFGNFAEIGRERLGVLIEIDEDELLPDFERQRDHAHGAAVEELDAFNIRRADQTAIERVGPAMIAATKDIFAAAVLRDGAGAVAADVAEGAERAFFVPHNDDRFTSDIDGEEGFRIGDGAFCAVLLPAENVESADELPGATEDAGFFSFENRGIDVELRSEGVRTFDLFVDVGFDGLSGHEGMKSAD